MVEIAIFVAVISLFPGAAILVHILEHVEKGLKYGELHFECSDREFFEKIQGESAICFNVANWKRGKINKRKEKALKMIEEKEKRIALDEELKELKELKEEY